MAVCNAVDCATVRNRCGIEHVGVLDPTVDKTLASQVPDACFMPCDQRPWQAMGIERRFRDPFAVDHNITTQHRTVPGFILRWNRGLGRVPSIQRACDRGLIFGFSFECRTEAALLIERNPVLYRAGSERLPTTQAPLASIREVSMCFAALGQGGYTVTCRAWKSESNCRIGSVLPVMYRRFMFALRVRVAI